MCPNASRPWVFAICSAMGGRVCAQDVAAKTSTPKKRPQIVVARPNFVMEGPPQCMKCRLGPNLAKPQILAKETLSSDAHCAGARTTSSLSLFDHALRPDYPACLRGLAFRCG